MSLARPISNPWLLDWFCWYAKRMVRQNFHAFAVDLSSFDYKTLPARSPLAIFTNHPGWWDPIVGMLLCKQCFPDRVFYAPIDAASLAKYRVFSKLGYFGIEANSRSGTNAFIEHSNYVLNSGTGSLWITPEGRFTDVRDQQQPFMPGLAHLAAKTPGLYAIPLAIEYVFYEERRPLLLCKLGSALVEPSSVRSTKAQWQERFTEHLRNTQADLAKKVVTRNWDDFEVVVRARQAPRGIYDWARWFSMRAQGQKADIEHGESFR